MTLDEARKAANEVKHRLAPHCERIEIAGSIRRGEDEPHDIEIVCIPKTEITGLFMDIEERSAEFVAEADRLVCSGLNIKGQARTGRYLRRWTGNIPIDIFCARRENWGLILAIRTGSADYSHYVLAKTWCRNGMHSKDGMLRNPDGDSCDIREEADLFTLLNLDYPDPSERGELGRQAKWNYEHGIKE